LCTRALLLCAVAPPAAPLAVEVDGLKVVLVRPTLWPREAHVRITQRLPDCERAESASRFAMAQAVAALRAHIPGFEKAALALSAHESFAVFAPKLDARSLPERLAVAGPAVAGRSLSLEERALFGEKAAAEIGKRLLSSVATV
jgi:hypothetical protein